jgi:hypothetical protein
MVKSGVHQERGERLFLVHRGAPADGFRMTEINASKLCRAPAAAGLASHCCANITGAQGHETLV